MVRVRILPEALVLPPRTITGHGRADELLAECIAYGRRGVLVHGKSLAESGRLARITDSRPGDTDLKLWQHPGGEATVRHVDELLAVARDHRAEWIAGVGGGSVLDVAKACAGLLHASLSPTAYQEGAAIEASRVPFIAAPTTAGTGSEATTVSVLTNPEKKLKKSIRHPSFMARLAVLDPSLLASCPPSIIACSGMDAFAQAVESFVSRRATWFSDELALKALVLLSGSLESVFADAGSDKAADLMLGSYLAGVALSNARLGLVHGLAHPLGARYIVAHGLACAVCLPHVIEFNRQTVAAKYERMSTAIGADLLAKTAHFLDSLDLGSPFTGKPVHSLELIVEETLASGSTAANPRPVSAEDVEALLNMIF